jgi:alpha-galactosidase
MSNNNNLLKLILLLLTLNLLTTKMFSQELSVDIPPPQNKPAEISIENNEIKIIYDGSVIFNGKIDDSCTYQIKRHIDNTDEKIDQVITLTSFDKPIKINGIFTGSKESFPCEVERKRRGLEVVRHSFGLSNSLLNKAIYDRERDWVLSIDHPAKVKIVPDKITDKNNIFNVNITGYEINIRFRPLYYQKHRGLNYYKPWEYKAWKEPVNGWCSWFAYFNDITEEKVKYTVDILSEVLLPFGYQYIQIDDGYQKEPPGPPNNWLNANNKFPNGLENLCKYISGKGLKPGIWTNVAFDDKFFIESNKKFFVTDEKGNPYYGRWIGYPIDGNNPKAIDSIIRPVYSGLKKMGWNYYKVDALRHLRYEGYNSNSKYFNNDKSRIESAFRNVVLAVRKEIGEERFMLGCWGIRPELIGIIDGCRIGGDGFGLASLTQYNSFNNVVWRNDPDHIELSEKEAYRSCMVTSLTGSLFMLTDKPEKYLTEIVEPAKRSVPTLFTFPGQIYDVDPSRSMNLEHVSSQLSGDGERDFDASLSSPYDLFMLEINKPYENYVLLGRTGESNEYIPFCDLGLKNDKEYIIFEFWSKAYLGAFVKGFYPGKINQKYNCQLFCIRERSNHPQIIATNRHISCGAYDIEKLNWEGNTLSGESRIVGNDLCIIYILEPENYEYNKFSCEGAEFVKTTKSGNIREIHIFSKISDKASWKVEYN